MINVICKVCKKEEKVYPSRAKSYKACSKKCFSNYKKSFTLNNCTCSNCKKEFHLKPSAITRYDRNMGTFCSMKCAGEYKRSYYKGEINPNFRGKQYDSSGYRINHYPKIGRIKEHHYVVFTFMNIDKLPKGYVVHHRDCDIYNNIPQNLVLLTENDHRWIHKQYGNATLWAMMQNKIDCDTLIEWSNDKDKATKLLSLNIIKQKENNEIKI